MKAVQGGPVLSVQALCKHFGGVKALDGIDLQVLPGELLGVIGPNGAGKTALINTITGFYTATSGSIRLHGQEISRLAMHRIGRLGIGRTFQNIRLFKRMSVLENVMVAFKATSCHPLRALLRSGSAAADVDAAMQLLDQMQLADRADTLAESLSYGDARRLEIARALAGAPELLLLDEPAAGMNDAETLQLTKDIGRIRSKVSAIVLIEHAMPLIRAVSDRIVAMDNGRTIAEGAPDAVLSHPEVLRAYLGSETAEPGP